MKTELASLVLEKPASLSFSEEDMARKRGIQHGHVYVKGPSWFVRFYEYDAEGHNKPKCERVGAAEGAERLTRKEAVRKAKELYLDDVNRRNIRPSSSMLVADFASTKFQIQVVERKKKAGKEHYGYLLKAFIVPYLGQKRLCDVMMDDVETMIGAMKRKGYSYQTCEHAKNCTYAVFKHARKLRLYRDENPAADIDLGEKPATRKRPTQSYEQAAIVVHLLASPYSEMVLLSLATSMNAAEMCGIRLKWCNFTDAPKVTEGEVLAPYSIAVRENFYRGEYGSLKGGNRRRIVAITKELAESLVQLTYAGVGVDGDTRQTDVLRYGERPGSERMTSDGGSSLVGSSRVRTGTPAHLTRDPESPLFASRNNTPLDAHNIAKRKFKPLERRLGFAVAWHSFRRAHSSFAGQVEGVAIEDRVATMGHADARLTLYYSVADVERRRRLPNEILEKVRGAIPSPEELQRMLTGRVM